MEPADSQGPREVDTDDLDERNAAIAQRAYEISLGEHAGSPEENWWRAAAEINAQYEAEERGR